MGFVGIDQGVRGAIAVLDGQGDIVFLDDMPCLESEKRRTSRKTKKQTKSIIRDVDVEGVLEIIRSFESFKYMIEETTPFRMEYSKPQSNWKLGYCQGIIVASIYAVGNKPILIKPKEWQKYYGHDQIECSKEDNKKKLLKRRSFEKARELFPGAELTGPKGGLIDGRCEALLIAHYNFMNTVL